MINRFKYIFAAFIFFCSPAFVTPVAADTSYACAGDNSQVCPNVSMIHFTSDATGNTDHSASSGYTYAHKNSTVLNFSYSSQNIDANKLISVQLFNITPGLKILIIPTSGSDTVCNPLLVIQKACQTRLNSSGDAQFSVALFDVQEGAGFNYQLVGATAWVSNFVRVAFTATGSAPNAPMTCAAQISQVCAPISALKVFSGSREVKKSIGSSGDGSMSIDSNTRFLVFKFSSTGAYAYKTVYVDFFGQSQTNLLAIDTSTNAQGIGCDKQVAVTNGCFIQLDSNGSATFIVSFAKLTSGDSFKFKLNGASYTSKFITVKAASETIFAPTASPAGPVISARGLKGVVEIVIKNAKGKTVSLSGNGIRGHSFKIANDSSVIYVTTKPGRHKISVKVGSTSKTLTVTTR